MANSSSTSSFRDYRKIFLACAVTFLCLNFMLAQIMPHYDSQSESGRSISDGRYMKTRTDVLFLGDSRAHEGLDPIAFAAESAKRGKPLEALNSAQSGMQGPFFYLILKDYLDHAVEPPKFVVADFTFLLLGGDKWFQDIYMAYYTPSIEQALELRSSNQISTSDTVGWYMRTHIPALRYNKAFTGIIDTFAADPLAGVYKHYLQEQPGILRTNDLTQRGYFSRQTETVTQEEQDKFNCKDETKIGIERGYSLYLTYFKKFFDLAASNKIHVIMYTSPVLKSIKNCKDYPAAHDYYGVLIKSQAQNNPYVHFVDYDNFWDQSMLADMHHPNQKGAEKLAKLAAGWVLSLDGKQ